MPTRADPVVQSLTRSVMPMSEALIPGIGYMCKPQFECKWPGADSGKATRPVPRVCFIPLRASLVIIDNDTLAELNAPQGESNSLWTGEITGQPMNH
jgi:hypothetical protein